MRLQRVRPESPCGNQVPVCRRQNQASILESSFFLFQPKVLDGTQDSALGDLLFGFSMQRVAVDRRRPPYVHQFPHGVNVPFFPFSLPTWTQWGWAEVLPL